MNVMLLTIVATNWRGCKSRFGYACAGQVSLDCARASIASWIADMTSIEAVFGM